MMTEVPQEEMQKAYNRVKELSELNLRAEREVETVREESKRREDAIKENQARLEGSVACLQRQLDLERGLRRPYVEDEHNRLKELEVAKARIRMLEDDKGELQRRLTRSNSELSEMTSLRSADISKMKRWEEAYRAQSTKVAQLEEAKRTHSTKATRLESQNRLQAVRIRELESELSSLRAGSAMVPELGVPERIQKRLAKLAEYEECMALERARLLHAGNNIENNPLIQGQAGASMCEKIRNGCANGKLSAATAQKLINVWQRRNRASHEPVGYFGTQLSPAEVAHNSSLGLHEHDDGLGLDEEDSDGCEDADDHGDFSYDSCGDDEEE